MDKTSLAYGDDSDEIGVEVDSDDEYNPDDDTSQSNSISQVSDTSLPTKILSDSRTGRALSKNAKMVTNSNNDLSKVSVVADVYVSDKRKSVAAPQPHKKKKMLPQSQ